MTSFQNKLFRFLLREPQLIWRWVVLAASVAFVVFLLPLIPKQEKKLKEVKAERALIQQLPDMEDILNSPNVKAQMEAKLRHTNSANFVLNGLSVQNGVNYAVIDGNIYKEGDSVGDYTLAGITAKFILLQDKFTQETRTVYFRGEERL